MIEFDLEVFFFIDVLLVLRDFEIIEVIDDLVIFEWFFFVLIGGVDIIGYFVERREVGRMNWVRIKRVELDVIWFIVESFLEGRGYIFRVFVENCEGLSELVVIEKIVVL